MTGQELYNIVLKKHTEYINHKSDDLEPPIIKFTTQQCFKLANYMSWTSRHYNNLNCLGEDLIDKFYFESVILEKEKK